MLEPLYQKLYQDTIQQEFQQAEVFQTFLDEIEKLSQWRYAETRSLSLIPLEGDASDKELHLSFDEHMLPLRSCAFKSLQDRAKVSGAALTKLEMVDPEKLALIYNACLGVGRGDALLRICADKISGVLSGTSGEYAILPINKLFAMTHTYLTDNYQGQFVQGSFEHHLTTAFWTLNQNTALLKNYKEMLVHYGSQYNGDCSLSVRFSSSDTGISSANLYPCLTINDGNLHQMTLGTPLSLPHKHGVTEKDYADLLPMLFGHFQKSLKQLTDLFNIPIDYPAQTMLHIAKRLSLPRKLTMQVIEAFIEQTDNQPCTAYDCYYQLNEIIFFMQCDGIRSSKIIHTSEVLSRALSLKWTEYDYFTDLVW